VKAAVCREFGGPLVVEEVELDGPDRGEVRVRVAACAICHSDILAAEGAWGGSLPVLLGHEAAGVVEAVGAGVDRVAPGDHVVVTLIRSCGTCFFCARGERNLCEAAFPLDTRPVLRARDGTPIRQGIRTGAFAEQVVVDASQVVAIPRDVPLDSASLLACGVITGLGAVVNTAHVPPGSHVVTIGTGGVGLNCLQGAALREARTNIAVDLADEKLAVAPAFGATHTINPAKADARAAVRELTEGRGADYVFVAAGSARAVEQGIDLLRRGGTLVVVGMPPVGVKAALEVVDVADNAFRILGSKMGSTVIGRDVPALVERYREGRLKLDQLVSGRYPLERINEAIAEVKAGAALRNVIVF
jgi:S-(hydroxymethyl)glutathione dehydrogenase / alcohol dehydrogenase